MTVTSGVAGVVSKQEPFLVFRDACHSHFLSWQGYLRQVLIMFLGGEGLGEGFDFNKVKLGKVLRDCAWAWS